MDPKILSSLIWGPCTPNFVKPPSSMPGKSSTVLANAVDRALRPHEHPRRPS